MGEIALKQPGVESAVAFPGLSINGFTNSSNCRHRVRHPQALRRTQVARAERPAPSPAALNQQFGSHPGRLHRRCSRRRR
jgi:hypothetical protein